MCGGTDTPSSAPSAPSPPPSASTSSASSASAPSKKGAAFVQRKLDNKACRTTVVKCGLANRLRIPALRAPLHDLVRFVSESTHRFGLVANYVVARARERLEPIPDVTDQTFIDRAMALTESGLASEPHLQRAWDEAFHAYPAPARPLGVATAANQAARSGVQTNLKNCIVHSFDPRQTRFVKEWLAERGAATTRGFLLRRAINGHPTSADERLTLTPWECEFVAAERRAMGMDWDRATKRGVETVTEAWRKRNPTVVLECFGRWLDALEARPGAKLFSIVPLPRIRASHIPVDTTVLWNLMRKAGETTLSREAFHSDRDAQWRRAFELGGLRSNRFEFAHRVVLDGVSLSVHFQAPRTAEETARAAAEDRWAKKEAAAATARAKKEQTGDDAPEAGPLAHLADDERVIGLDPGRTNIAFAAEILPDGEVRTYKLTRRQYYAESGMLAARKKNAVWNAAVQTDQDVPDEWSMKTADTGQMRCHIRPLASVHAVLWEACTRPACARLRFHTWSGRAKSLDAFFKRMRGDGPAPYIAYGDADFAPAGRGRAPVPTTTAARRCKLYFGRDRVAVVDEHRTSAICCGCGAPTCKVMERKAGSARKSEVRGLRLCRSTICSGLSDLTPRLVDRDLNGALNILRVARAQVRPVETRRGRQRVVYGPSITLRRRARTQGLLQACAVG